MSNTTTSGHRLGFSRVLMICSMTDDDTLHDLDDILDHAEIRKGDRSYRPDRESFRRLSIHLRAVTKGSRSIRCGTAKDWRDLITLQDYKQAMVFMNGLLKLPDQETPIWYDPKMGIIIQCPHNPLKAPKTQTSQLPHTEPTQEPQLTESAQKVATEAGKPEPISTPEPEPDQDKGTTTKAPPMNAKWAYGVATALLIAASMVIALLPGQETTMPDVTPMPQEAPIHRETPTIQPTKQNHKVKGTPWRVQPLHFMRHEI